MSSPIIIITPPPPPTHSGTAALDVSVPDGMTKAEVAKLLREAAHSLEKST